MKKHDRLLAIDDYLVVDRSNLLRSMPPMGPEPTDDATQELNLLQIARLTVLLAEVREHTINLAEIEAFSYRQQQTDSGYTATAVYQAMEQALTQGMLPCLSLSPPLQDYIKTLPARQSAQQVQDRLQKRRLINPDPAVGDAHLTDEEWLEQRGLDERCQLAVDTLCTHFHLDMQRMLVLVQTRGSFEEIFALLD